MWRAHPENRSPQAWEDLVETLTQVLSVAEATGVTLAVEPEPANVVADAMSARRLLDSLACTLEKIILDPANLANVEAPNGDRKGLAVAIDLLAADTVLVPWRGPAGGRFSVCPAGQGIVEFRALSGPLTTGWATADRSWFMASRRPRCRQRSVICARPWRHSQESLLMPSINLNGEISHYASAGEGLPFVFQHGMGADVTQPLSSGGNLRVGA